MVPSSPLQSVPGEVEGSRLGGHVKGGGLRTHPLAPQGAPLSAALLVRVVGGDAERREAKRLHRRRLARGVREECGVGDVTVLEVAVATVAAVAGER